MTQTIMTPTIMILLILSFLPSVSFKLLDTSEYGLYKYTFFVILWASYFLLFYGIYRLITDVSDKSKTFKNVILVLWIIYAICNISLIYTINYRINKIINELISDPNNVEIVNEVIEIGKNIKQYARYSIPILIILIIVTIFYNGKIAGIFSVSAVLFLISYIFLTLGSLTSSKLETNRGNSLRNILI